MADELEYLFDVQCPFAYLASTQVRALAAATGAKLVYKPVLLGGIYNALGDGGPYKRPPAAERTRMTLLDAQRWAALWGVPLRFAPGHPVRSVLAMRCILASGDVPRATHALFEAAWVRAESIADPEVIRSALSGAGFDDVDAILTRAESQAVKDELRANTDLAVKRGAFGVPTFFVKDEMFWGQDRLDFVARALGAARHVAEPPSYGDKVTEVEAFFDYASPFAYLGMTQIERVAREAGAQVRFRPFLLGGLFREIGTPDVPMLAFSEQKRRYYARELDRFAGHFGVPFRFTTRFPMRTILPLRATYAVLREREAEASPFIQAVFRALWVDDRDISSPDILREICRAEGLDPSCVDHADAPENKQALLDAGKRAKELGLCGAPTFVVAGQAFWGQDRLDMVAHALSGFRPSFGLG
jgi:2-hydroxychromene-2-carboxylate isomerase